MIHKLLQLTEWRWWALKYGPKIEVQLRENHIQMRRKAEVAQADAPFSAGELLVSDGTFLEDAFVQAIRKLDLGPRIRMMPFSIIPPGRAIHPVEGQAIFQSLKMAGGSIINWGGDVLWVDDAKDRQDAYITSRNARK